MPTSKRKTTSSAVRTRLDPTVRKEQLVRTAIKLFGNDGVEQTSVLRITTEAGVSNGVFYHYFSDKRELEEAVAELVVTQLVTDMFELQKTMQYTDRIAAGAVACMMEIAANRELGSILAQYYTSSDAAVEQTAVQLAIDIEGGAKTGEFPVHSPGKFLVTLLVSMFAVGGRAVLNGEDPRDVGEFIAAAQLRMLGVPKAKAASTSRRMRELLKDWKADPAPAVASNAGHAGPSPE